MLRECLWNEPRALSNGTKTPPGEKGCEKTREEEEEAVAAAAVAMAMVDGSGIGGRGSRLAGWRGGGLEWTRMTEGPLYVQLNFNYALDIGDAERCYDLEKPSGRHAEV